MTEVMDVPIWANILIYMAMYQWYLLCAILPTVYFVVVKLFGFPLLQRWSQEVVIILYPTKVKFAKLTSQYDPYFAYKNGLYWPANPLYNVNIGHKFTPKKEDKKTCGVCNKIKIEHKSGEMRVEPNPNQIHVFTHAINQPVYSSEKREEKLDELLNNEHKIKNVSNHGIWIMRQPLLHFHRHWALTVDASGTYYKLEPVRERQQFNIGFYHTLGVFVLKEVEIQVEDREVESGSSTKTMLKQIAVTNQEVITQLKFAKEYQNFSASHAYRICRHLKRIEANYFYWVSGSINPILIVVLGGAAAAVALMLYIMHGSSPALGPMPK